MAESSTTTAALQGKSESEIEELLDRMLTRLALCDDSKLEPLLSKVIPLTISSLSSNSSAVRNKVLEILSHVNKRVKHHSEIGLPLAELWKIFTEAGATQMVKNFCIVYIEMAFERVNIKEKESMAPLLLANISKLPQQHQDIILRIASKVFGECHSNHIDHETAKKYRLTIGPQDRDIFVEYCLHTILYQPQSQGGGCPPGLSVAQTERVTGKHQLKNDALLVRKLGILNVIEAMELSSELVYPLFIASCADSQEAVVKKGEELLKKKAAGANLDDPDLIRRLFMLFNGTTGAENISAEFKVIPANYTLKAKLMSVFCRSITAANSFPSTLQCIFGCMYGGGTTSRLKQLGMEFTVWVFKHAKHEQLKLMGPVILNAILKSLDAYSSTEQDAISGNTKPFAYQAIGLLAQRLPNLFRDKVGMVAHLFEALKVEPQSLRLVIQEATNSLAAAYKDAPATVLGELEKLLLKNAQVEESEVRFCAVRWATSLFDMQHCASRYICMLGAADTKLDVREMALEGLFPTRDEGQQMIVNFELKYPKFHYMLDYILEQQPKMLESTEMMGHKLFFSPKTYVAMIKFLLMCFESDIKTESHDRSCEFQVSAEKLCLLLEHAMSFEGSVELHAIASKSLISIGSHIPELIATHYAPKILWLKQLLGHMDSTTRESAARLLGIATSALPLSESCALISELVSSFGGTLNLRFEAQHGILSAVGYITADCMSKTPTMPETLLQTTLKCLINIVNSESTTLASIAMQALGHIALRVPLPPLVGENGSVEILSILQEKLSKIFSSDDVKAIQKVVISLGHICVNETASSILKTATDLIVSLCRSKVEDILFAAGEALAFLWGGVPVTADLILKTNYSSLSATSKFLTQDLTFSSMKTGLFETNEAYENSRVIVRDAITRKLFDDLLYSSRKEERCSGTVWLLSLTMYCGQHPSIQHMLPEIQEAFSHLISEQNELTQELASQGMSIVYDLGDESMKRNLVNALVGTLTGSGKRKRAVKLVQDSEVFQEGAIGQSPGGGKLTTYKELCSLANEMGQPDLIYKFMDLANYQASLNSKRGAAFGFSKIAKQAGDALKPHLRLLIPRLIRYQYDPEKNVQDAMAHIWKSLIADPKKAIDDHLDLIIDDLLIQCGSRLWRSREASCLALADIIQGRRFGQVGKHLKSLWTAAFRAMDDIKETVRNSGDKLCRALTSLTIRLCDISLTEKSDASQAMDIVLPFLLAEGILSKVESIRKASIGVVMKLAKGAGVALRSHLPDLVCCMLESLSSLEDQGLNYVEFHAENAGIQKEKLESLRVSIAKSSPMWETLDLCINVVDSKSLDLLIPRLAQLIRSGVGLNTRVGLGSFISLLVQKVGRDIKPFAGMLLKQLFPVVKEERSIAVKRSFSGACAIILKYTSASQAQKLIEDTTALHAGDRNAQISCAVLLKSYSSMASDVVSGYQAVVIPVVFISRFEDDKFISDRYDELWEEYTSGERITLQLYLGEIVSHLCESLTSSSWASKKKAAHALVKLSEVLGESLSSHHGVLLKCLMKEIPGRLWEGKDALLHALGALSKSCHKAIVAEDSNNPAAILSLVSSACSKKVKKYREAAYSCLEQVIKAFENPEFFNVIFPSLFEVYNSAVARKLEVPTASDAESDESSDASVPHEKILECLTCCIHVARINDIIEAKKKLMAVVLISLSAGFPWTVKMSAFSLIEELCLRLHEGLNNSRSQNIIQKDTITLIHEFIHSVSPKVIECISVVKIAQVHITASACLLEITKLYRDIPPVHQTDLSCKSELFHQYEVEKNEVAKSTLKKCMDIIENLKQDN